MQLNIFLLYIPPQPPKGLYSYLHFIAEETQTARLGNPVMMAHAGGRAKSTHSL